MAANFNHQYRKTEQFIHIWITCKKDTMVLAAALGKAAVMVEKVIELAKTGTQKKKANRLLEIYLKL